MTKQDHFIAMISANKGIIYKVANVYCENAENRKDLIQEIMVQLWLSFDRYDNQFRHSTWIYRIALNTAISFYRKDHRRKTISLPVSDDSLLFFADNDSDETEPNLALLHQFLTELHELDRALMLLYLEEKTHLQIAEILGITTTNVATKIGRIKERLKRKFSSKNN
ncbi:sigma-70 family RNA polymerase sigma factor [Spirosoma daeguense]